MCNYFLLLFSVTQEVPALTPISLCVLYLCLPSSYPSSYLLALSHNLHRAGKVTHPRSTCRIGVIRVIDSHLSRGCNGYSPLPVRPQHNSHHQLVPEARMVTIRPNSLHTVHLPCFPQQRSGRLPACTRLLPPAQTT